MGALGATVPGQPPGTVLIKTENGQCHYVRLQMPPNAAGVPAAAIPAGVRPGQPIRLQSIPVSRPSCHKPPRLCCGFIKLSVLVWFNFYSPCFSLSDIYFKHFGISFKSLYI